MTGSTTDIFERYKERGLAVRKAGQWDSARVYLLEAARTMIELSKAAKTESLIEARKAIAAKMLELAKDCETAKTEGRTTPKEPSSNGGGSGRGPAAAKDEDDKDKKDGGDWLVKEKPNIKFEQVAGLEDVKRDIKLKMLYPFQHPELAKKFGINPGGGILFYGPPGTGKTMLAKATAGELDAAFFVVQPAQIMSKWVGEAEQNIKALFDAASKEARSVIFIDEIEALIPARGSDGSGVMQRVVPQILQSVQGFTERKDSVVMLLGATNVPWQLDPAMLRPGRFDQKIYIPLPDRPARLKMLEIYLKKRPLAEDVSLDNLADKMDGYSGADIKFVCDRAATLQFLEAIGDSTPDDVVITGHVLDEVVGETKPSVNKEHLQKFEAWAAENQSS
ncbi:MAG: ATP-binding protein [Tepidisphaeraceae bacterium]